MDHWTALRVPVMWGVYWIVKSDYTSSLSNHSLYESFKFCFIWGGGLVVWGLFVCLSVLVCSDPREVLSQKSFLLSILKTY